MAGNTFGQIFRLTTFGESHGAAIGGIVDGCPAGLRIDEKEIQAELDLRKPGAGGAATSRKEDDRIRLLSGIFEGRATGTPIAFCIENLNQRSGDYGHLANVFRPGHADYTYYYKYGGIRDFRGGGRASGRETAARVAAGAIAKNLLRKACGGVIYAAAVELGGVAVPEAEIELEQALGRPYFAASSAVVPKWDAAVEQARKAGDTLGGIVRIVARNIPPGLGEPVFDKLGAVLAHALMSVGAVKGVEIGAGFGAARITGSVNNDPLYPPQNPVSGLVCPQFGGNNAGGILGGISTGQDIVLQVAVKPIASIARKQDTIDREGHKTQIQIGGRHDLSAIPRVVPVLSAMTALALADALLLQARMGVLHE